jgi:hypothetical protein
MIRLAIVLAVLALLIGNVAAGTTECRTSTNAAGATETRCRSSTPPYKTTTCRSTTNVAGTTKTVCR